MVFEFLVVLIVSLVFGNGLLYLTAIKQKSDVGSLKEQIKGNKEESQPDESTGLSSNIYVDEVYSVQASLRSVNEKIKLAHERINELEVALGSLNSVLFSSKTENNYGIEEKIKRLENFRRNTGIEMEAIKKLLKQLKEFRKIKGKKSAFAKKKEEELNKKIHNLVFNIKKSS